MRRTAPLLLSALVVAACSGGGAAPATLPTAPPTSAVAVTSTTSAATTTTGAGTGIELSPDGPWMRVDSAPGITEPGLVYQLMEGLWVYLPVEEDIAAGRTWVLNEADRPVIEAYLMARLVYYRALSTRPMTFTDPGWQLYYSDAGSRLQSIFRPLSDQGYAADLSLGVVLRPAVAGEARSDTTALILDCNLDGAVLRLDDGSLEPSSVDAVVLSGVAASMDASRGQWILSQISDNVEGVCD